MAQTSVSFLSDSYAFPHMTGSVLEYLHRYVDASDESTYSVRRYGNKFAWLPVSFMNNVLSAIQV